jgi:pSer/pThr/pTyr-binding forkhead associated (FHA) protein
MSRHHASILLNGDQLLLEDNCSKFGTLVLANSKGLVLPFASKDKIAL